MNYSVKKSYFSRSKVKHCVCWFRCKIN